jgi:hypothetical protein
MITIRTFTTNLSPARNFGYVIAATNTAVSGITILANFDLAPFLPHAFAVMGSTIIAGDYAFFAYKNFCALLTAMPIVQTALLATVTAYHLVFRLSSSLLLLVVSSVIVHGSLQVYGS